TNSPNTLSASAGTALAQRPTASGRRLERLGDRQLGGTFCPILALVNRRLHFLSVSHQGPSHRPHAATRWGCPISADDDVPSNSLKSAERREGWPPGVFC